MIVYKKYFKSNSNSYMQVVINGDQARKEVYSSKTDMTSIVWDLPIAKTFFRTKQNLIKACKQECYTLITV